MNRIQPVSFHEFLYLMDYAQEHHATLNEPIPQLHESQYGDVKSCLETPFQTFANQYLYKGFHAKAAILFYLLNKNHPLVNGNKRMACLTLGYFCHKNGYAIDLAWQSFYDIAKTVTDSDAKNMDLVVTALRLTFLKFLKKGKYS